MTEHFTPADPFANSEFRGRLVDPNAALTFMMAGNSTITLRSERTGSRFTYKIKQSGDGRVWFVNLLRGPDNESDYIYIGIVDTEWVFRRGQKSKVSADAPSAKAFNWTMQHLVQKQAIPDNLEIWHEGRCGRCGRKLTVPESVERGIGPECINFI